MDRIVGTTIYRQGLRTKILDAAMFEFRKIGIKGVKMDDIAGKLSISKRTLYEIYSNKEELLYEGIRHREEEADRYIDEFQQAGHTVMEVIIEYFRMQVEYYSKINPLFFSELHKYPKLIGYLHEVHEKRHEESIAFLYQGVEEGFFLSGINFSITSRLTLAGTRFIMSSYMYREFSIKEIFYNSVFLFIRGYCTPKGLEVLDRFLTDYRNGD